MTCLPARGLARRHGDLIDAPAEGRGVDCAPVSGERQCASQETRHRGVDTRRPAQLKLTRGGRAPAVELLELLGARWYRAARDLAPVSTARIAVVGEVADRF